MFFCLQKIVCFEHLFIYIYIIYIDKYIDIYIYIHELKPNIPEAAVCLHCGLCGVSIAR